jgi:hypothetical protein
MATVVALGASWRNNSSRLVPSSLVMKTTPVKLAPGRLRLATRPSRTGSLPVANTTGVAVAAALAARAPAVLATITAAFRLIKSANRSGSRSSRPSAQRCSIATLRPSTKPASSGPDAAQPIGDDLSRLPKKSAELACAEFGCFCT